MKKQDFGNDKRSAFEAKTEAQKIAFGPVMFQAARALVKLGNTGNGQRCRDIRHFIHGYR